VQSLLSTLDVADVWLDGQHEQVSLEFNTLRSACTDFFCRKVTSVKAQISRLRRGERVTVTPGYFRTSISC